MRIWSIHPAQLPNKSLVACWAETLQGIGALEGKHKMHINHPQLNRFKAYNEPVKVMKAYLYELYLESLKRGFKFDLNKISGYQEYANTKIPVSVNQFNFESEHLNVKLNTWGLTPIENYKLHPMFVLVLNPTYRIEKVGV